MKIRIEVDESITEEEVIIRCKELSEDIHKLQEVLKESINKKEEIVFYKEEKEFYFSIDNILFFEIEDNSINAHTKDDCYRVKYKLYELESILPKYFTRVSKSTILNINHIYSISKNLTGASLVEFQNTYKKVYISRSYYKLLKLKMLEKRR